jgi:hypothetical protein
VSEPKGSSHHRPLGEALRSPLRNGFRYNRDMGIVIDVVACIKIYLRGVRVDEANQPTRYVVVNGMCIGRSCCIGSIRNIRYPAVKVRAIHNSLGEYGLWAALLRDGPKRERPLTRRT